MLGTKLSAQPVLNRLHLCPTTSGKTSSIWASANAEVGTHLPFMFREMKGIEPSLILSPHPLRCTLLPISVLNGIERGSRGQSRECREDQFL